MGGASLFILVFFLSHSKVNVSVRWGQEVGVCSSGNTLTLERLEPENVYINKTAFSERFRCCLKLKFRCRRHPLMTRTKITGG